MSCNIAVKNNTPEYSFIKDYDMNRIIVGTANQGYSVRLYQMLMLKEYGEHVSLWRTELTPKNEIVCVFTKIRAEI